MNVITMEEEAFFALVRKVVDEVKATTGITHDKWIDAAEAMHMLRITSKATLQKLRDEGKIRFSQPMHKVLLYDRDSILAYIDKHAKSTF